MSGDFHIVNAFMYVKKQTKRGFPSIKYIDTCVRGYVRYGLGITYLKKAYQRVVIESRGV